MDDDKVTLTTFLAIVSKELFRSFLVAYIVLIGFEIYKKGFVTNFFNLNWLLMILIISGVAMVLFEPKKFISQINNVAFQVKKINQRIRKRKSLDGIR